MVSEFEFIDNIKSKYGLSRVGDDCAVLPKDAETDLVITADLLIEDIDFRLDWATPAQIGHKALAVSLSDIAAMGAEPKWAMLSIGFPQDLWKTDFADRFYEGWYALARKYGVELVGGDVSASPDKLIIDSIVGGEVAKDKAVLRSGARPGDGVYVSGTLGGAAAGLKLLEQGGTDVETTKKLLEPFPQVTLGKQLSSLGLLTSMIDISDGLSSDLRHICRASNVGAIIDRAAIPIDPAIASHFGPDDALALAIDGGEDFQLLFTSRERLDLDGIIQIGEITDAPGEIFLKDGGTRTELRPRGFQHF